MLNKANQTSFKKGNIPPKHKEGCVCFRCAKSSEIGYKYGFKKGHKSWNEGKHHIAISGKRNNFWKGDKVGYMSAHQWIRRWFGKAKECVYCGKTKDEGLIHWANINHKYSRKIEDYVPLCVSCHKNYDLKGVVYGYA